MVAADLLMTHGTTPPRLKLLAGFAAIYFVWGSTFLAIKYAAREIPPFFMAGTRFVSAGVILWAWRRLRHGERPARADWKGSLLVGGLLFLAGNGSVSWSSQRVPSGLIALMLAAIPLYMVLLDSLRRQGSALTGRVLLGVALGMTGLGLLIEPSRLLGGGQVDPLGAAVLLAGSFCWALGSVVSRTLRWHASLSQTAAMQMLCGGLLLCVAGLVAGEPARLDLHAITPRGILCLAYLTLAGSVVAFTAYSWLLSVTTPARVATYAYVNPLVAVLLGWALGGEPLTPRALVATVVIVAAVALIIGARTPQRGAPVAGEASPESL
jgi:drug/metabolite transporter (DMT)-like permease